MKKSLVLILFVFILIGFVSATTIYLDPNGDSTPLQWDCAGNATLCAIGHYAAINQGVRYNNPVNINGQVSYSVGDGSCDPLITGEANDTYDMTTASITNVSSIKIYVFGTETWSGSKQGNFSGQIYVNGAWQTLKLFPELNNDTSASVNSWSSITYTGSFNQTDIDNLRVRIKNEGINVCQFFQIQVYNMYAEITDNPVLYFPPNVTLIYPQNSSQINISQSYFYANFTDSVNLLNATLYLWYRNGSLVGTNSTSITGTSASANLSFNLPVYQNYTWNYLAFNAGGNSSWAVSNFSLEYLNTTIPYVPPIIPPATNSTICGTFQQEILDGVGLAGILLTLVLVGIIIGVMFLSFSGVLDISMAVGGISLEDGPKYILIVALIYLLLATLAYLLSNSGLCF